MWGENYESKDSFYEELEQVFDHLPKYHMKILLGDFNAKVQSISGSRGVRISGSNAGYTTFRGSVKSTGYPLHSPVSPSLPLPCVTVCHHISTGLYSPTFFLTSALDGVIFTPPPPSNFIPPGGESVEQDSPRAGVGDLGEKPFFPLALPVRKFV
jgi:hypothetical protein